MQQEVVDFEALCDGEGVDVWKEGPRNGQGEGQEAGSEGKGWDVVIVTLGTSKHNAGSAEKFERIDRESVAFSKFLHINKTLSSGRLKLRQSVLF